MELFINAINYCKDGLKKAIDNNEDEPVIQAWVNELRKWITTSNITIKLVRTQSYLNM